MLVILQELLLNIVAEVIAGLVLYLICKWLDDEP